MYTYLYYYLKKLYATMALPSALTLCSSAVPCGPHAECPCSALSATARWTPIVCTTSYCACLPPDPVYTVTIPCKNSAERTLDVTVPCPKFLEQRVVGSSAPSTLFLRTLGVGRVKPW